MIRSKERLHDPRPAHFFRLRRELIERFKIPLMLAPVLTIIIVLFVGSIYFAVSQSLGYLPVIGLYDLNFQSYWTILTSDEFWYGTLVSMHIAFTATLVSTVLAVVSALVLRDTFVGRDAISFLFQLSLSIPHMVVALAILLLTTQGGLLARIIYATGLITEPSQFPELVFDRNSIGIILVYILKEVPFMGIIVLAILQGVGRDYEETAVTLGANRWQRFRFVILPLILPGTLSAFIIVFAYVFGAFEIPYLLGRTDPAALPVVGFRYYLDVDLNARTEAMTLNVFILLFVLILTGFYMKISRLYIRKDQ